MPHPDLNRLANAPTYRMIETAIPVAEAPDDADIVLSIPKRALRLDEGMLLEGRDNPLPHAVFSDMAIRCTDQGAPIVRATMPLFVQLRALNLAQEQLEADLSGHREDLIALRAAMPANVTDIVDDEMRKDAMLFDVLRADPRDPKMPQADLDAAPAPAPHRPEIDPVLLRMEADTRIGVEEWTRVIDLPPYQSEPIRAIAREMLAPVLGNAADLEDMRVLPLPKDEVERSMAVRNWLRKAPETRELQPFSTPAMPGYATSAPIFSEKDGVGVVYFEDFMSGYAYVFQTNPDLVLDVVVDPDRPPRPF
ncbi:hypothetical protein [Bosea sp. RAC05]|uniref:hypothetical protein n=1 Tax=Bosea sp. RAC05 TaxID=1842539 RepID=UPI00083E0473|nr:hypothetical protein [Bosea sp. RAC05]AOG03047.1 hypothetical protein BSY19_5118 [Bosea sp. RAC05]